MTTTVTAATTNGKLPDALEQLEIRAVDPVRIPAKGEGVIGAERAGWLTADLSDIGNARRFAIDHHRHVRYVPGPGWHVWDGRRWALDVDGAIDRLAEQTADAIRREAKGRQAVAAKAEGAQAEIAKAEADAWTRNAKHVTNLRGLRAMIEQGAVQARLIAPVDALDADPHALNVHNGTLDLRTGELREHRRDDLITKLADVEYDPDARDARFERYLRDATGGDTDLAAYLQRAAGYTATGDTSEEVFFIAHGPAASGKTTFLEALKAALGDYSRTASPSVFVTRRQSGPSPDLARLPGARLVACSELGPGAEFTAETIKSLTGGDRIFARALYRDGFEYAPAFKIWFASNDLPRVAHEDAAMWRRVHALPFVHGVPEERRDDIKQHLIHDEGARAAVLAWVVAGAVAWRREGLSPPAAVLAATEDYRAESDTVAVWLGEECELDPDARTTRDAARRAYETWCEKEGRRPVGRNALFQALRDHRVTEPKSSGVRCWGLRI